MLHYYNLYSFVEVETIAHAFGGVSACLVLGTLINHSNKALKQVQVSLQISKLGHLSQQEEDLDLKVARSYTILSHLYSNYIYIYIYILFSQFNLWNLGFNFLSMRFVFICEVVN